MKMPGQSLAEYGLVMALVAVVAITGLRLFGKNMTQAFEAMIPAPTFHADGSLSSGSGDGNALNNENNGFSGDDGGISNGVDESTGNGNPVSDSMDDNDMTAFVNGTMGEHAPNPKNHSRNSNKPSRNNNNRNNNNKKKNANSDHAQTASANTSPIGSIEGIDSTHGIVSGNTLIPVTLGAMGVRAPKPKPVSNQSTNHKKTNSNNKKSNSKPGAGSQNAGNSVTHRSISNTTKAVPVQTLGSMAVRQLPPMSAARMMPPTAKVKSNPGGKSKGKKQGRP